MIELSIIILFVSQNKTNNKTVFKVIQSDITKSGLSLTLFGKTFKEIQLNFTAFRNNLKSGGLSKGLNYILLSKSDIECLRAYNDEINKGRNPQTAFYEKLSNSSNAAKNLAASAQGAAVSTELLDDEERRAAIGAKILGTALNMALNIGVGLAINFIITQITQLVNKQKEIIEKNKELAASFKSEKENLESLKQEYIDIIESTDSAAKKDERLVEWKKTLARAYGLEEEALRKVNQERETGIALIDEEIYKQAQKLINETKGYEKALKKMYGEPARSSDYNLGAISTDILDSLGLSYNTWEEYNKDFSKTKIHLQFDTSNINEQIEQVGGALAKLKTERATYGKDYADEINFLQSIYDSLNETVEKYGDTVDSVSNALAVTISQDYFKATADQMSKVADEQSFEKWKDGLLELAGANEVLKEKLAELADKTFPQYSKAVDDSANSQNKNILSIKKLTDTYEELSEVLDDLFSKQDKLAGLYEKIAKGTKLSASEVRELIELFPELTGHLVGVGSKWSFDIKGVNEAFDKLEDGFVAKAQETIDNNKKIIEQSFEDYYAENTKLNFDDYLKENEVDTSDTNSLDYRTALVEYDIKLQKERNALLESYEERQANANSEIEKAIAFQQLLNNQINDFDFDVDNYNDKIKELMDASEKMVEGEALSYDELTSLIDKFPELTYSGKNGEYFIEKSALDELIQKSYEERNARIDDEIAKTYAVNEEVANRIKAYEDEKTLIENAIKENRKKYDESYDNLDLMAGILERIELDVEHTKLIKELNALDKEQYEADKALMESQDKHNDAYRKYLEALKGELTGKSKDKAISQELQNQIDYYKTIISAIEIMRDKYSEAFEKEKEALENEKKALQEGKDALKDANDERQRELDLIEARNNLENAKKRKVWVYSEGEGFKQVTDQKAVSEAEEKYHDVITNIQEVEIDKKIAELDKKIEENEKQQEAFEKSLEDMTKLEQNIEDAKTVEQAKTALGLADENDLLNLSDAVKEGIKNGLAEAIIEKDNEENKDKVGKNGNSLYTPVALDDVLKFLRASVTAEDLKTMKSELPTEAVYNAAVKGFADSMKEFSEKAVQNVTNNNNGMVVSPTFNIYDASDPNKVAEVVNSEITNLLTRYNNSIK